MWATRPFTNVYADGRLFATYNTTSPTIPHYHFSDWLGSRRIQAAGATGSVEATWWNQPFGDNLVPISSADATEHHFTGKERDTESGNDYFGARYYSSSMGRFMSPDYVDDGLDPVPVPWAKFENPQSLNLYGYVLNNPLTNTDPDGNDCVVQTRTDPNHETVSVSSGNCDNVKVNTDEGQTKTYIAGTVDVSSIQGNGSGGITFDYTSYGGDAGVASLNGASEPDHPGIAYGWGNNAQGWHTAGVTGATMNDPRTYAIWLGASVAGATCVLYCAEAAVAAGNAYVGAQSAANTATLRVIAYLESQGVPATAAAAMAAKMLSQAGSNPTGPALKFYYQQMNQMVRDYRQSQGAH